MPETVKYFQVFSSQNIVFPQEHKLNRKNFVLLYLDSKGLDLKISCGNTVSHRYSFIILEKSFENSIIQEKLKLKQE